MAKLNTITTPVKARFRLVQDDSCHWYAIPADKREEFDLWVKSFDDDNYVEDDKPKPYTGVDFDEYRLNMHVSNYSFANLREDK